MLFSHNQERHVFKNSKLCFIRERELYIQRLLSARPQHDRDQLPERLAPGALFLSRIDHIHIQSRVSLLQDKRCPLPVLDARGRPVRSVRRGVHQLDSLAVLHLHDRYKDRPRRGGHLHEGAARGALLQQEAQLGLRHRGQVPRR